MFYKSLTQIYAYLVCVGCVIGMLIAFNTGMSDAVDLVWAEPVYQNPEYKDDMHAPVRDDYKIKSLVKSFLAFLSMLIVFSFHWRMAKKDKERLLSEEK